MKKRLIATLICFGLSNLFYQIVYCQTSEKLYRVRKNYKDEKQGFINYAGIVKIACAFDYVSDFYEGYAVFKNEKKYGVIDSKGNITVPADYDELERCSEGLMLFEKDGKKGYMTPQGKIIINNIYERGHRFTEGLAAVRINGKWGYINKLGKLVIPANFVKAYLFHEGMAKVIAESKSNWIDGGFIDKTGKIVIPCKYYTGRDDQSELNTGFYNGLAPASIDGKNWGFLNRAGIFVIKPTYSAADNFSEGLANVWKDDHSSMGFINTVGKLVIPFNFSGGESFSDGLAKVNIPNKEGWAYIDKNGKTIIEPKYRVATNFENGFARVLDENQEQIYINKAGNFFHSYFSEDIFEDVTNMAIGSKGYVYTGKMKNGMADGFGKMTYSDGSWYEGNYRKWGREGIGTFRSVEGLRYYGNWINDQPEGIFQVKQWTLGGLVSNEWYAKYENGNLVSSEQTKADFDNFLNNKASNNNSSSNSSNSKSSTETKKTIPSVTKFESMGEISVMGTKTLKYYVKFSDGTTGYIYKYYEKDGGKWAIYDGLSKTWEYSNKDEVIAELYKYKN